MSVLINLTWYFWRLRSTPILVTTLSSLSLVLLLYLAVAFESGPSGPLRTSFAGTVPGLLLHCALFGILVVQIASTLGRFRRCVTDQYTLPVKTWLLVSVNLANGAAAGALMYIVIAAAANVAFRAGWPYLGPALFCGVAGICTLALIWMFGRSVLASLLAFAGIGLLLGQWLAVRFGVEPFQLHDWWPKHVWTQIDPRDLLEMAVIVALAYGVAIVGVRLDRCGWVPRSQRMTLWLEALATRLRRERSTLGTPHYAMFWATWRGRGTSIPLLALIVAVVVVGWTWAPWLNVTEAVALIVVVPWLGVILSVFLGMYIGQWSPPGRVASFRGTRPVSDVAIANSLLCVVAAGLGLAWLIWAVAMTLVATRFVLADQWPLMANLLAQVSWQSAVAAVVCSWTVTSNGVAAALLSGSRAGTRFACGWLVVLFAALSGTFLRLAFPEWLRDAMLIATAIGFGIICGAATATAFVLAVRRSLVRGRLLVGCLVGWLALAAITATWYGSVGSAVAAIASVGVVGLPFLPIALCPLAVSWNRHQ